MSEHVQSCSAESSAETAIAALAKRFWSIHPKEIQDLGITREQFYEREMRALFAALAAPVEPYAWVIPGDDQSRPSGSIDAMAWREGEFTKPLYAQMPAAGMSRDDAESLVFDLLDAARSFDRAETAFRRGAREYYEEMRDKVISALSIPHRSSGETK